MKTIIYNGKIHTYDNDNIVEAIYIEDEIIKKTGKSEEILKFKDKETMIYNCEMKTVMPGLNDSHMHLYSFGLSLQMVNLMNVGSVSELISRGKNFLNSKSLPNGNWIRGRGWNQDYFSDKRFPNKQDLDKISTEHPIVISRACGHVLVANTKALEMCNIDEKTEFVLGGEFDIDMGIFRENAMGLILDNIPTPSLSEVKKTLQEAMKYANSQGLTSIQSDDLAHIPNGDFTMMIKAYEELRKENNLTCRIYEQCLLGKENMAKLFEMGYKTGIGDNYFKIGPLKILSDGSLGARTAAMSKPYADDPNTTGIMCFTQQELDDLIIFAHKNGMQAAVHCIGDKSMHMVFESYEKALKRFPRENHRHGIIHCQITNKELLNKFQQLNALAYVQPIFLHYDLHIVESRVGKELASTSYAFKTLQDLGVHVAYGTDCPVEALDTMPNLYCAVTRTDLTGNPTYGWNPQEKVTVKDAVYQYTLGSAYASFEEGIKGSLSVDKLGDLIVLNEDIFTIEQKRIKDVKIDATFVGGKLVYQR